MIPLLSPKSFAEYSPEEYVAYVRTLYIEPEKPPPPKDFTVSVNKKGNPVFRISRKPKFLMKAEVTQIALDIGWPLMKTWLHVMGKKIEIRRE